MDLIGQKLMNTNDTQLRSEILPCFVYCCQATMYLSEGHKSRRCAVCMCNKNQDEGTHTH